MSDPNLEKSYAHQLALKYGCNPHQSPAALYMESGGELPFKVLNGKPGYINLLDALNGWQLVKELHAALDLPAATSFKHVSPAGAAVAVPLKDPLPKVYELSEQALSDLSPMALAYLRARGADPMSSFGDFAAFSNPVDVQTARILKTEVSDGLIAPGFEPEALEILKSKKGGNFIVLEANPAYQPPETELKEVYGVVFSQKRNDALVDAACFDQIATREKNLPPDALRDLILAAISIKYTQSNSVGYALDGQMIGVGAGQQSRVDCTKLAGKKVEVWYLRQHPSVLGLPFKPEVRKVDRTNARVRYIEGDFTPPEYAQWKTLFSETPPPLTEAEKSEWVATLKDVSLASDAFFPFRDSIDQAARRGVKYVTQPGGSVADEAVIKACDEYGMVMSFTGLRLFHH